MTKRSPNRHGTKEHLEALIATATNKGPILPLKGANRQQRRIAASLNRRRGG